jgi:dihydrofolate synthase/folylpolyglutamate synthase
MSYAAAIQALNAMTPELHTAPGHERRKFSLDQIRLLLAALEDPQLRFPSVLIAGTNGKGSTASTLASILTASGLRTGLYTSPHLERINERIRIGADEISDEVFARLYFQVKGAAESLLSAGQIPHLPSFFEFLTAIAFLYFSQQGIEIAVLEVGMGGRLDATNVVEPLISVITDISLDHTEWLGSTISAIAREKAGILRPGGVMVTLPQLAEANQALGEVAVALDVRGVNAAVYMPPMGIAASASYTVEALGAAIEVHSPLSGSHQQRNVALAIATAVELAEKHGFSITPASLSAGISSTRWPGRFERLSVDGIDWVLDVAHNPAGAWALRSGLNGLCGFDKSCTLIFSCLRDKPVVELARILFPIFAQVILAPLHSPRAASLEELQGAAAEVGIEARREDSIRSALELARRSSSGGLVVVSGSVYLVGEARSLLLKGF